MLYLAAGRSSVLGVSDCLIGELHQFGIPSHRKAVCVPCRWFTLGRRGLPRDNLLQSVSCPAPVVIFMSVPTVVAPVLMVTTTAGGVIPSHLSLFQQTRCILILICVFIDRIRKLWRSSVLLLNKPTRCFFHTLSPSTHFFMAVKSRAIVKNNVFVITCALLRLTVVTHFHR